MKWGHGSAISQPGFPEVQRGQQGDSMGSPADGVFLGQSQCLVSYEAMKGGGLVSGHRCGHFGPFQAEEDLSPCSRPVARNQGCGVSLGHPGTSHTVWSCDWMGRWMVLHGLEVTVASFALNGVQPLG